MSNITEQEIEKLAEKEYPVMNQSIYNEIDGFDVDVDLSEPFREAFIIGYKAALQNKVSDEEPNKDDIIKEAKRLWKIPNKLEAVKLVTAKLGYSLKHAKAYCEDNFDKGINDISAQEVLKKWFLKFKKENPSENMMSWEEAQVSPEIEFYLKAMEEYASIVNERRDSADWISVEDRLPEFNINVLALSKKGRIIISCVTKAGELDDFELEVDNGSDYYTHWMPLPAPPVPKIK